MVQNNFVNKLADLLLECINNKKHKLFFFDPVHQTHNNENARGWMEKGAEGTKNVLSNTGRRRVNIIGGLNALELEMVTIVTEANCNKELMVCYLEELKACNPECEEIYIVLDNASYNRAYEVKNKAVELGIKLVYLPPYCPNLNIIERLWKFFKKKIMKNMYYKEFNDFLDNIYTFFKDIKEYENELLNLLSLNFQIIKAS
jgi:transposase